MKERYNVIEIENDALTEEEINIIIEYTLARFGLMENEHELRHIENKSSKTPDRDER